MLSNGLGHKQVATMNKVREYTAGFDINRTFRTKNNSQSIEER